MNFLSSPLNVLDRCAGEYPNQVCRRGGSGSIKDPIKIGETYSSKLDLLMFKVSMHETIENGILLANMREKWFLMNQRDN